MIRFLTLTAILIGALWLSQSTLHAQDADLPVASPDEIVILGEVPDAPPGTNVWAFYFISDHFPCGQTTTDVDSRFVLVVDATCATPLGPAVCWGDLPDWKQGPEELCDSTLSPVWGSDPPDAGETVDMGRLVPSSLDPVPIEPVDDLLVEIDEPAAAPDEIIFIGEAPASSGTEVTAHYLQLSEGSGQLAVCGTTNTDEESRFLLVVDASCAEEAFGPVLCWGPLGSGSCQELSNQPFVVVPRDGRTFDVGLLAPREFDVEITSIPTVGTGPASESSLIGFSLWLAAILFAAGVTLSAHGLRRSRAG